MRTTYWAGHFSSIAALVFLASCGRGKDVSDYLTQVAMTKSYSDEYVIATHRSGEPSVVDTVKRIHVFSLGARYVAGISTPIRVGPSGHSWVNAVVKVSGADGYFELSGVGGCDCSSILAVTISESGPRDFVLQVAAPHGSFYDLPIQRAESGTGDVQVSLALVGFPAGENSVIDLHVVEPSGEELYYGNKGPSATGGQLDLASAVDCSADGRRIENVFWPSGRAPRGSYTVRVGYRSPCVGSGPHVGDVYYEERYGVTVAVRGQLPQVFPGVQVQRDQGGAGSGRTIATFSH